MEEAQDAPVYKYPAKISSECVNTGKWGSIPVYFIAPKEENIKNIIFYIHGAGWVFGSFHTHEKLIRELAARTDSLVVFPEYSRSPEAKYPTAIEQCYFILSRIRKIAGSHFSGSKNLPLIVAGDSVGGNMAIAMTFMSLMRQEPKIHKLLLYYPVTSSCEDRNQITASPLRADMDCLKGFPPTMIINGQADVLRSEGEAFGEKLRCAGVDVTAIQVQGTIHDFVMLNALDQTNACRTAMDPSVGWLDTDFAACYTLANN